MDGHRYMASYVTMAKIASSTIRLCVKPTSKRLCALRLVTIEIWNPSLVESDETIPLHLTLELEGLRDQGRLTHQTSLVTWAKIVTTLIPSHINAPS